jgi:hypothetical protein
MPHYGKQTQFSMSFVKKTNKKMGFDQNKSCFILIFILQGEFLAETTGGK